MTPYFPMVQRYYLNSIGHNFWSPFASNSLKSSFNASIASRLRYSSLSASFAIVNNKKLEIYFLHLILKILTPDPFLILHKPIIDFWFHLCLIFYLIKIDKLSILAYIFCNKFLQNLILFFKGLQSHQHSCFKIINSTLLFFNIRSNLLKN